MGAQQIRIRAEIGEAVGQVGLLPAGVRGAVQSMMYDMLSHHRLKVISNARKFPGRRGTQKMVASRLFRYTQAPEVGSGDIAGVRGEAFAAKLSNDFQGEQGMYDLEFGRTITTRSDMILPIAEGAKMVRSSIEGRRRQFRDLIEQRKLTIIRRPGKTSLLVREIEGRRRDGKGMRFAIMAVFTRRRVQRPLLGWFKAFDEVVATWNPRWEKAMDLAATEAGRIKLIEQVQEKRTGRAAGRLAYQQYIAAHPGREKVARKVERAAARAARKMFKGQ